MRTAQLVAEEVISTFGREGGGGGGGAKNILLQTCCPTCVACWGTKNQTPQPIFTTAIDLLKEFYCRVSYRILGWGGGGIKCVRKHITCASLRKIIELHFNLNLHTTVSINTVNLFIHCTISIV